LPILLKAIMKRQSINTPAAFANIPTSFPKCVLGTSSPEIPA